MNRIQVLDCTLRDGGYCNNWRFGFNNTKKIIRGLFDAGVDIVECGFLTQKYPMDTETTCFTDIKQITRVLPPDQCGKFYVAMMNYGEYDVSTLPECMNQSLKGIRVAFHKNDRMEALKQCQELKNKGYKVFIQAMVSLNYSDEEFLDMIRRVNEFEPYAFYIVDSFGMMKSKSLCRLFYMVENSLKETIKIGFHSHNNMQLAFSNAQQLISLHTNRDLIIDCSVYGMGRGAGNLNTELFVDYLNENFGSRYHIKPLLTMIDEILNDFYQQSYWGYSLPNYLSAVYNTHPNYADHLDNKKTLTVEAMNEIFDMMHDEKRVTFDKDYIEKLYITYMANGNTQKAHEEELKSYLCGQNVVLVAPGRSSIEEKEKILSFLEQQHAVCISVNHCYKEKEPNYIFVSNMRRYREIDKNLHGKCIITSNISATDIYLQTQYYDLLNNSEFVKDNAGLMAIRFLMSYGVRAIYLAGFDGYSHDEEDNYSESQLSFVTRNAVLDAMNTGMIEVLKMYKEQIPLMFLTKPKYVTM